MVVTIGLKAPNLKISKWVQGLATNIDKLKDSIVLVEVFQVNCPGCFLYGMPEAVDIYKKYRNDDVRVIGLATAFEDYDKNTVENLELLLTTGEVIGETRNLLGQYGQIKENKFLPYKIPFPVAMDSLLKETGAISQGRIMDLIIKNVHDFETYNEPNKAEIIERAKQYLSSKQYVAETFEEYGLKGTPSSILIDKKGILRQTTFGQSVDLEDIVKKLLNE